jgi:fructokinase
MASTLLAYLRGLPDDTLVMIDPNCRAGAIRDRHTYLRHIAEACERADVVKVSNEDAEYLAPGIDPVHFSRSLVARGVKLVLLTAGADGTRVLTADGDATVPAEAIEVVDTIGAGDSFGGAFLTWWLDAGLGSRHLPDVSRAVHATIAAHEVSALTCQRAGADPPHRSRLSDRWQLPPHR